ncbi:hypothetical protein [Mesorhizobium sp. B3-1-7]|uniref:hypothetical protein n=1 Tax=Mesorhizobium sp. B3-1-7 TaxID=2589894 RepID=UPI001FEE5DCA|nr:hypothetical protein [Mesorhizobium sp. B3-1-7]
MLSVTQVSAKQIGLVSVRPVDDGGDRSGNGGSYYHCEGVALPQEPSGRPRADRSGIIHVAR